MPAILRAALEELISRGGLPVDRIHNRIIGELGGPVSGSIGTDPVGTLIIEEEGLSQLSPDGGVQSRRTVSWRLVIYSQDEAAGDDLLESITRRVAGKSTRVGRVAIRDTARVNIQYATVDLERGVLGWSASALFSSTVHYEEA